MKTRTIIGAKILAGVRSPLLQLAEEIALTHHERWDGTGYARLEADAIPLAGRIVAVVDTFDALTHDRPYKRAWPVGDAVTEISRVSGTHSILASRMPSCQSSMRRISSLPNQDDCAS